MGDTAREADCGQARLNDGALPRHAPNDCSGDGVQGAADIESYVIGHIDQAIELGWVRPYYQAIVRASTGDLCGEEALARWVDPEHGVLAPDSFIPALEKAGLLYRLDMHIVDCVLADMHVKRQSGVAIVPVSVNLSRRDLGQIDVAEEIARKADAAGVPRSLVRVEFTESAALGDSETFGAQVVALHEAGFEVWMDDFGSGYSSLSMLDRFGFDLIKLDMEFIQRSAGSKAKDVIAGVVQIAGKLGVGTLAEGIETEEQALLLEDVGIGMLQGYFYSRPLPLDVVADRFHEGVGIPRENREEDGYWDAVGGVDLAMLSADGGKWNPDERVVERFPAGVLENRGGTWRVLRANAAYRDFLAEVGFLPSGESSLQAITVEVSLDEEFLEAAEACLATGEWTKVASRLEYGTGLHYRVKHVASSAEADAFVVAAAPTTFGQGLGVYGDVPVAYAVFRVVLDEARQNVVDTEYVYANPRYCEWGGYDQKTLVGRSFLEINEQASTVWFPYCYQAAILGEDVHDVVYSPETGHWLSFYLAPSPIKDCCVYAFAIADDEHHEREAILAGRDGADFIIDTINKLSRESSYETAMNGALEMVARLVEPERIRVFEIEGDLLTNTFEWCAAGIEPQKDRWQNMGTDNDEAGFWIRFIKESGVVLIPDVRETKLFGDVHHEWFLKNGVTSCLSVPLYHDGVFIGYLGVDNYAVHEGVDTNRLLESVASFISSRISIHKLKAQLRDRSSD